MNSVASVRAVPVMPASLLVHAEVVLQRDRGERLVLLLDAHALLGLDRLVQALRPAPALEDAAGELVDDLHLAVDDRVVDVALVQRLGLQRLDEVVDQVAVLGPVQVVDAEEPLGLGHAALGDRDGLVLLVELVVEVGDEVLLGLRVQALGALAGLHRACARRAKATYSSAACSGAPEMISGVRASSMRMLSTSSTIANGCAALDLLLDRRRHVVAQVVEAELGVRAVRDVGGVGGVLLLVGLHVLQHADA